MFNFKGQLEDSQENQWRFTLDSFVKKNERELSALFWGLLLEWQGRNDTLGIDLKPTPHFVACPRKAIEILNENVDRKIQEILGIIDGSKPEEEVVIIVIGDGQVKLINFKPEIAPAQCWEESNKNLADLITLLEQHLAKELRINKLYR
jgi:uncharacterized protein YejL (UPF0352 family)